MKRILLTCTLLALTGVAVPSGQTRNRPTLTLEGAKRVIAAAVADARAKQAPGAAIAVVDDGGNLMALERLDNTFAAGARISAGKARTAVLFKRPTRAFEEIIRNGRTPMIALEDFTPLEGGVPIVVDGEVVGGVGVSGAASAAQDQEIAVAAAAALQGTTMQSSAGSVSYFPGRDVAAAFQKGAVLFDGNGGRNYMVHASRRDAAGMAEIHTDDTDIIYVLDGGATFVTGGTVVQPATTAPGELRGPSISGGESRRIAKGDVLIVPNGTPHWFKSVDGPFSYYVVKVR